ncbi:MAG: ParB-like nuclease domain protein [Firmicutes bacterium ADurb.Bin506]|nr:MAG: ParB-like nuclease domain protein [Firmicutes bacterium ADurb.Bin506]
MQMQTKRMLLRDISPAAYNPRKRLEPGDKEYEALKGSIQRWGLVDPLVVNVRTGNLVSGHQRYNILEDLGETETDAVIVDLDERQERLLNIAMNKVEGQWDYGKLEILLSEFETDDITFTGFSEGEIATLFGEEADGVLEDFADEDDDEGGSAPEPEEDDGEFNIYLSFPDRAAANEWLEEQGLDRSFPKGSRNMVVHMEGTSYGNS